MSDTPKCYFCNDPLGINAPSEKALERFTRQTGVKADGPICASCINKFKSPKGQVHVLTRDAMTLVSSEAVGAIKSDDYARYAVAQEKINRALDGVEALIKNHLDVIEALNERRTQIVRARQKVAQHLAASPSANYFNRRTEADRYLAKIEVRREIFGRDGYACKACGTRANLSIDHIIPVRAGGTDDHSNLQTLCIRCNSKKGFAYVAENYPERVKGTIDPNNPFLCAEAGSPMDEYDAFELVQLP